MNNSVFGKTMENIRKHRNIKLVNDKDEYLKNVIKSNFKSGTLLGPDLMGCEMGKVKSCNEQTGLSWPSHIGFKQDNNV